MTDEKAIISNLQKQQFPVTEQSTAHLQIMLQ